VPSADVPLSASVAPFFARRNRATLAIALGIQQPDVFDGTQGLASRGGHTTVDVLTSVFAPDGRSVGTQRQALKVTINPTKSETWEFQALSRVVVPPGRYEVRLAIRSEDARTASVYTYVTVPDFSDDALSLSGVVLAATGSPRTAPPDAFKDLMPVTPTTRRTSAAVVA
jgi:hypothetical protein